MVIPFGLYVYYTTYTIEQLALDIVNQNMGAEDAIDAVKRFNFSIWFFLGVIVTASIFLWQSTVQWLIKPIGRLVNKTQQVNTGALGLTMPTASSLNEANRLAEAFNSLVARVHTLVNTSEKQVRERTQALESVVRSLEITADVSSQITQILDLAELLQHIVTRVKDSFGYYHAQIYLIDEETGDLVMIEGTGEVGQTLKAQGHRLKAGQGIVGTVAATNQYFLTNNVDEVTNYYRNPLLPNTKSELAVPLHKGDKVLGVLDVQSRQLDRFSVEIVNLMQSVANQAAVAIDNAKLYQQAAQSKMMAERASQAKSDFLSSMSHELRTPLNGILGYAQILKRDDDLTTLQTDGLDIIQQSGEHLLTLISDILDLSKIEAGKLTFHPTATHLTTYLEGVASMVRMRAQQKGIGFIYEALTPLPTGIEVDKKRLRQILINLLGNAIKFTDDGQVSLRVSVISKHSAKTTDQTTPSQTDYADGNRDTVSIRFEVTDTGVGMKPEQLERIFRPFEQVGDVTSQAQGTGLGLSISRQLVNAMGGELQVQSEVGQGSTFWFEVTLPAIEVDAELEEYQQRTMVGYKGPRQKVLVVDDKSYNRSVLINVLEPIGFEVITAEDGRQGIEQMQAEQPDIIFMDMIMPVMMGFEAVQQIRQMPGGQDITIFGASASVFEKDRERVKLAGCDDFLAKPINYRALFELLDKHLDLEWIYDDGDETLSNLVETTGDEQHPPSMVAPAQDELKLLFDMAMEGDIWGISERALELEQMDTSYKPFAQKLQKLVKAYDEDEILSLIEQYMEA